MTALGKGIGRQIQLGIAKETTRGTSPSTPTYYLPYSDGNPAEKFKNVVDNQVYGVIEDNASQTRVSNWAEFTLKGPLSDTSFPLLLLSLFGGVANATHSGESIVYDHTLTVAQNVQHQSLSFYVHDPIVAVDYSHANGVLSKISIDYEKEKYIDYSATALAQKGVSISSLTPSQTAENLFVPQYLTATFASSYSGIGSGSVIKLQSAKIDINANVKAYNVLGNIAPADFLNEEFSIEGTLEAIWENESDFKTNALANTAQAMRLDLINTDVTIGSSTHPEIQLNLAKVYFTEFDRPIKVKNLIYQTVKFKAAYSISDAFMAKVICTNLVASY